MILIMAEMVYYGPRWLEPTWRLYLDFVLGAALVVLLVGDMDFKIVDSFVMDLWPGFTLVLVNVNGFGGGGGGRGAERTDGFKQVLPCDVNS